MSRSLVVSLYLALPLVAGLRRHLPAEARSAFVHRGLVRVAVMQEYLKVAPNAGAFGLHEHAHPLFLGDLPTAPTVDDVDDIEAWSRGWLMGVMHGASQDPRKEPDFEMLMDWVYEIVQLNCSRDTKDDPDVRIPPVAVGGRRLIRRARTVALEATRGATSLSIRLPRWTVRFLEGLVPGNLSALGATAIRSEMLILNHNEAVVVVKDSTRMAFNLGAQAGVRYGTSLLPSETLGPAHVEALVAREIAAYRAEPVGGGRPGRVRGRSTRG